MTVRMGCGGGVEGVMTGEGEAVVVLDVLVGSRDSCGGGGGSACVCRGGSAWGGSRWGGSGCGEDEALAGVSSCGGGFCC